jgi:hypothetical protein
MDENEIIEFLTNNLSIETETKSEWNGEKDSHYVTIRLRLSGKSISSDTISL